MKINRYTELNEKLITEWEDPDDFAKAEMGGSSDKSDKKVGNKLSNIFKKKEKSSRPSKKEPQKPVTSNRPTDDSLEDLESSLDSSENITSSEFITKTLDGNDSTEVANRITLYLEKVGGEDNVISYFKGNPKNDLNNRVIANWAKSAGANVFKNLGNNAFLNYVNTHVTDDEKLKTQGGFINTYNLLYDGKNRTDWVDYLKSNQTILQHKDFFRNTDSNEEREQILKADFYLSGHAGDLGDIIEVESLQEASLGAQGVWPMSHEALVKAFESGQIEEFMRQFKSKIAKNVSTSDKSSDSSTVDEFKDKWKKLDISDKANFLSSIGIEGNTLQLAINK